MRFESADVVIIGAGASGLAAAIEIGMIMPDLDVVLLEKNDEPGRKIRATGSGRCNISNTGAEGYPDIIEFFRRIGLVTREYDNGLVYPYSESAADVAELLAARAVETGARIITGAECSAVERCTAVEPCAAKCAGKIRRFAVNYRCGNSNAAFKENRRLAASVNAGKVNEKCADTCAGKVNEKYADAGAGKAKDGYAAAGGDAVIYADYVILAVGGKAGPTYGTTGDGYRIARELGHRIVTPVPVLTGIECLEWSSGIGSASSDNRARRNIDSGGNGTDRESNGIILAGTRTRGRVRLYKVVSGDGDDAAPYGGHMRLEQLCEESGEIQFTRYGLSGICVFNLTRHMRYNRAQGESIGDFIVSADLFPDGDIREFLADRREYAHPEELTCDVLRTVLKENIAKYVLEKADVVRLLGAEHRSEDNAAGMSGFRTHRVWTKKVEPVGIRTKKISLPQIPVRDLTDADIDAIAGAVHDLIFHPSGIRGWKEAQATSGGVSNSEINEETCESMLIRGLYITGELADRDYPCGGYNLSNAWLTGLKAAHSIYAACNSGGAVSLTDAGNHQ